MIEPQTNSESILVELLGFANSDTLPSEFEIRKITKEIEQVGSASAAEAFMLFGMFACVQGDIEGTISNHEKSLKLDKDHLFYNNYINSLVKLIQFKKAFEVAEKSLIAHPGSKKLLTTGCNVAYKSGNVDKSVEYFHRLKKLIPENEIDPVALSSYQEAVSLLEKGFSVDQVQEAFSSADSLILKYGTKNSSFNLFNHNNEWSMLYNINATPEIVAEMNDEMCEELSKLPYKKPTDRIAVIFSPDQ